MLFLINKMIYGSIFSYESIGFERYGRIVANNGFIQALVEADHFREYHLFFPSSEEIKAFKKNIFDHAKIKYLLLDDLPEYLSKNEYFIFHNFSPFLAKDIYLREQYALKPYPITGYTHSLAHQPFMSNYLFNLLSFPKAYDGIVCSCRNAQKVLYRLFDHIADYYQPIIKPDVEYQGQTAIIPIGVEEKKTNYSRKEAREKLGLDTDKVIFLNMARFSPSTKMDLFPIFELIKENPIPNAMFIFGGATNQNETYIQELNTFITQNKLEKTIIISNDVNEDEKNLLYSAANVYLALADNFQETYGISLIEAMKYSLPILAMDWDGYKDTVQNDYNGFLIPTYLYKNAGSISPIAPVLGSKFAFLFSQQVFIDKDIFLQRLKDLTSSEELRNKLGENSRTKVNNFYLWPKIIDQYMDFWKDLNLKMEEENTASFFKLPYLDYKKIFDGYPTKWLSNTGANLLITSKGESLINNDIEVNYYSNLAPYISLKIIIKLLVYFKTNQDIDSFWQHAERLFPDHNTESISFHIGWMIKQNLLNFVIRN